VLATRPDYDVAILDVRLGDDLATDVARTVQQQGKRIVYLTGYADLSLIPHELSDYPILPKPVRPEVLVEVLSEA
jgi:two-component SAPR family response regulator